MLLLVEKSITGGISNAIYQYEKANNKNVKDYDKNHHHHIIIIGM